MLVILKVQGLIQALDLDLETKLSHYIGPVPAKTVMTPFHFVKDKAQEVVQNECQSWKDYWQYESQIGLSKEEVADFYDDVAEFSLAVDRLAAKLDYLRKDAK